MTAPDTTRPSRDLRPVSDYLRGFAMVLVLLSHYREHFLGGDPLWEGYGNAAVALFLVLSGYGNGLSLRAAGAWSWRGVLDFYLRRFTRIYPLYYVGLLSIALCSGAWPDWRALLGLEAPFWFVHAIIQCYLAAPILLAALARMGPGRFVLAATAGLALVNLAGYAAYAGLPGWARGNVLVFRHLFLGHVYLFAMGLALPSLALPASILAFPFRASASGSSPADSGASLTGGIGAADAVQGGAAPAEAGRGGAGPTARALGVLGLYLAFTLANGVTTASQALNLLNGCVFAAASVWVCAAMLNLGHVPPPGWALRAVGRASYPIYILEAAFHYVLLLSGPLDGARGVLRYLLFFPLFWLACRALDLGLSRLAALALPRRG